MPFAAFVAAEEIHASGVIAVVVAGLLLGHKAHRIQSPQARVAERLNWRMIAFLLENTVFLLIGLQAWWIVEGAAESDVGAGLIVALCTATLAACIGLRLLWVFPARYLMITPGGQRAGGRSRRGPTRSSSAGRVCAGWSPLLRRSSSRRTPSTARS